MAYGWGLVWGLGGVTYGRTLTPLGMAFANSFILGVTIVTGALIPLALHVVESPPLPLRFGARLIPCVAAAGLIGLKGYVLDSGSPRLWRHVGRAPSPAAGPLAGLWSFYIFNPRLRLDAEFFASCQSCACAVRSPVRGTRK